MSKIRILHIDDHILFTQGVRSLLSENPVFEWIGEATSGKEGLEKAKKLNPDLVLVDYFIPESNGVEIGIEILKALPTTKLMLLTMENSFLIIQNAREKGFSAWISKAAEKDELLSTLERVGRGDEKLFPEQMTPTTSPIPGNYKFDQLTKREREILLLIIQGLTSQEIANKLFLSLLTVNTHRRNLLSKLGIKNFAQLSGGSGLGNLMEKKS
ncbi:MAG: LuxR C-terminal-related transcriptional regulator [Algoriphagus aquaeductus]|jgi:DNA-binding NarL/FixJ family response regulator|uniref:response regulator transcription factor n=1 Tax=Algoriphagus TaxID=246875 RepID=UPI0025900E89|nr:response regulator transcription factor [Algoriphagus sp.]